MSKEYNRLRNIIEKDGWYLVRTNGSHHIFKHPTKKGTVTIPHREINKNIELSVQRQAGIKKSVKKVTKKSRKNPHPKDEIAPISQIYVCSICGKFNKNKNEVGCIHSKTRKSVLCYERSLILSDDKTKVIKAIAVRRKR